MAGFIINLNSLESLRLYATHGVYSTILNISSATRNWHVFEATFADYASMKPGDNIYFFIKRKIYGIGKIINLNGDGISECRFNNFPEASKPQYFDYNNVRDNLLWDEGETSKNQRWICCFIPSPAFYKQGVDMDEVLSSKPQAFRMLRAFWKVSFLKIDDEENLALKEILLRKAIDEEYERFQWLPEKHQEIESKLNASYELNIQDLIRPCYDSNTRSLRHEAALEAYITYHLRNNTPDLTQIFGRWNYISRQVVASPFKPIDYMDKMDIFGYSFISGIDNSFPLKHRYLLIELKKDTATIGHIDQTMKYVDWIKNEYAGGTYRPIKAFLVAKDFSDEVIRYKNEKAIRIYTTGLRPAPTLTWDNLSLVKYEAYENGNGEIIISFEEN